MLCEPWVTGAALLEARSEKLADVDPDVVDAAAVAASEIVYGLSARKFPGRCRATLRPAARRAGWSVTEWGRYLAELNGGGFSGSWGYCYGGDHRSCLDRHAIDLGVYPVVSVDEVSVDGAVLDPASYRVDSERLLVRLDGNGWPTCQDPTADPATAGSGAFVVTVTYGAVPPQSGIDAAMALAVEFALARTGRSNRLPARVSQVARQGVSWTVIDPMTFLDKGKSGIYEVDLFLAAVNPHGQKSRPAVLCPELDHARRTSPITSGGS